MAKTTEQLLQQAVQIRDEQANKKNTALRVGTLFSDIIEKQEESDQTHASDVTKINESINENKEKLTELASKTVYNTYIDITTIKNGTLITEEQQKELERIFAATVPVYLQNVGFYEKTTDGLWTKTLVLRKESATYVADVTSTIWSIVVVKTDKELNGESFNPIANAPVQQAITSLSNKVDTQLPAIENAKNEAIESINQNEQSAISNFNAQRITPEMLSESTKQLIEASGGGTITNLADDEDIESVDDGTGNNVLKFKSKPYFTENFSGLGRVYLRKNMVEEKNVLIQNMVSMPNTIYHIQYDYDLGGSEMTIPEGCILNLQGCKLSNGTIILSDTIVFGDIQTAFSDSSLIIKGIGYSDKKSLYIKGLVGKEQSKAYTADDYHIAYTNKIIVDNYIRISNVLGIEDLYFPSGEYPFCYYSTDEGENVDTCKVLNFGDINVIGLNTTLYVIYDENGTNPYYKGTNPSKLQGTLIVSSSKVCGLHLIGERQYRTEEGAAAFREQSYGIGFTNSTSSLKQNLVKGCIIEKFSGDGISTNGYMEQAAGWPSDSFTSVVWDASSSSFVPSKLHFTSIKHTCYWLDLSRPLLIRNSNYFLYCLGPLKIVCFDEQENYIQTVTFYQGQYFYLPKNAYYFYLTLTREVEHDIDVTENWGWWIGYGYHNGAIIEDCVIQKNQRGGISNVPNETIIRRCNINNNGNAVDSMPAFRDTTQFGINIEDIYIHNLKVESCIISNCMSSIIYRCWGISIIDTYCDGYVNSLNYCADFYAKNSRLYSCTMSTPLPIGKKIAIGCTFRTDKIAQEISVVDDTLKNIGFNHLGEMIGYRDSGAVLFKEDISKVLVLKGSLSTQNLILHYDFSEKPEDLNVIYDKVHNFPASSNDTLDDSNWTSDGFLINNTNQSLLMKNNGGNAFNYKTEIVGYEDFASEIKNSNGITIEGFFVIKDDNSHVKMFLNGYSKGANIGIDVYNATFSYYYTTNGETEANAVFKPQKVIYSENTEYVINNAIYNNAELKLNKVRHFVACLSEDGSVTMYYNGYKTDTFSPPSDFKELNKDAMAYPTYWFILRASSVNTSCKSCRMYNRVLTEDEIRQNFIYELNRL